jgi:hypothetical protein
MVAGIAAITAITGVLVTSGTSGAAGAPRPHQTTSRPHTSTISMNVTPFTPVKPKLGTDLYHCSLLNPGNTVTDMITSDTVTAGSPEDHHAILYLVEPSQVTAAEQLNDGGKGWTCFGGPGIGGNGALAQFTSSPWLAGWAPGHGTDILPSGTGMPLPAGALVVVQMHYNLLVDCGPKAGDKGPTDHTNVQLNVVPEAGSGLKAIRIVPMAAPPDLPCPKGVHGALCSRAASLKDLGKRFGASAISFVNTLEWFCGRTGPHGAENVGGDTTSCTYPASPGVIRRITPHMHLLGVAMTVTLDPGTPNAKVLLTDSNYNFDQQIGYDISPTTVTRADTIGVTCTYNPTFRQLLPQLRTLAPRWVTWGDGSSDEMCLALLGETAN